MLSNSSPSAKNDSKRSSVLKPGYEKQTVSLQDHAEHGDGESQTYLRVAEIVLAKALTPLKAREIVDIYNSFGLEAFRRTLDSVVETVAGHR